MRILLLEICFENFGGYFRAYNIALELSKKGHFVKLVVPRKNGLIINKKRINDHFLIIETTRCRIHTFFEFRFIRVLYNTCCVLFEKYDFIYGFVPVQPDTYIPLLIGKLLRKKVILDWDDFWQDPSIANAFLSGLPAKLLQKYLQFLETLIPGIIQNVTVASEFLKLQCEKTQVRNILQIENGVSTDGIGTFQKYASRVKLGIPENEKIIISIANTYPPCRVVTMIEALKYARAEDPHIRLYLNVDLRKYYFPDHYEIPDELFKNIICTGYLQKDALYEHIVSADAALFSSDTKDAEKACFPIRLTNYLYCGKPILTNAVGEARNLIARFGCGAAVDNLDYKGLGALMVKACNDPEWLREKENAAAHAASCLSWSVIVQRLEQFMMSLY